MDSYGIKRNIDPLGRITLPSSFRKDLDINPGDMVEICLTDNNIVIKPIKEEVNND